MAENDTPPPTITAMKIPIIRKGEYDIWSMRMRQYISHTDHNLWDVIVNGDLEEEPAPTSGETSAPPAPKTAKQLAAKRNQERVKSILLLAIPDEYLLKFHNVPDAKSLWAAIKSRFGGNEESKKMQKNVLKHQFENFATASNESLDKAYDRFQKLISQLEVHGAPISKEDINQKFLRSLPSSWNQIAIICSKGYDIALESLESRILGHEKNELAWEKDELKDKIAKWEDSSKNLDEILNSQMSARDKTGLGYGTQLTEDYELNTPQHTPENSLSIFDVRSSDEESTPANDRSSKQYGYRLDEYAIRNKIIESQTTELNIKTSETAGKTNNANTEKPKTASESVVSNPKINRDRVIIEDWNSDDEEEVYEVQTVRPETQTVKTRDDKVVKILRNKELVLGK
ncbi:hypothetical protein Tco_0984163 [Tanacetum coccineum]